MTRSVGLESMHRSIRRILTPTLCCWMAFASACSHSPRTNEPSPGVVGSPSSETYNEARVAAQVEKDYVIGPAAARELEYRVGWQFLGAGNGIKLLAVQGDSVFVLDNRNLLTRIKTVDGNKLWRVAVADPIEEVQGVTLVDNRVFLTTGGTMVVLDGGTGSQIDKRKLEKIANTEPTKFGQTLIYGSRDGQAIWFSSQIGYQWRGYKVAHSINLPPVVSDNRAIVVGNDGTLVVLDAASASRFWSTKLLDQIVAPVAAGNGVVYVAGMDQYLWAFDLNTGRTIWKTLNESALMQPPTLIGDHVYQQIPHQGLVCFTAIPQDMPGGERVWASAGVAGNALFQRRDHVYAWDASAKRMSTLDAKRGGVIASVDLPQVKHLTVSGQNNNDIYAVSNDGRVIRLVPRN